MPTNVAKLCEEHGFTPAELTERSGVEDSRVLAIIMGRWTPSPDERKRIAGVFGVAVDEISWGHKTPIQHIYGHGPG